MKEKIIIGNQKNYMTVKDVAVFLEEIKHKLDSNNVIICPSNIYLPYYLKKGFKVGLQNIAPTDDNAYTGEITSKQAKHIGVEYVIVGHSERRSHFNENSAVIESKLKTALNSGLIPILCVGETLEEKNTFQTKTVLTNQLLHSLSGINHVDKLIIAYEPVWAIGTNITPTNDEIKQNILMIREIVKEHSFIQNLIILYGGSVSSHNIDELKQIEQIDGFLVGKASIEATGFLTLIDVLKNNE